MLDPLGCRQQLGKKLGRREYQPEGLSCKHTIAAKPKKKDMQDGAPVFLAKLVYNLHVTMVYG